MNGDGAVDIADLILVASRFGETIVDVRQPNPDVDGDGSVDIRDLTRVAMAFGWGTDSAALASSRETNDAAKGYVPIWRALLTALEEQSESSEGLTQVRRLLTLWIQSADELGVPYRMQVGANFPNPFNAETWIPFELREATDVHMTIYDADGRVVRHLSLGKRNQGRYWTRGDAAYWDGRNERGEGVASGTYFYELSAGTYRATRRFVVIK